MPKENISQIWLKMVMGFMIIGLSACVPQGPAGDNRKESFPLIQAPVLSGDFGSMNQLTSKDKVFSFTKTEEEEISEVASISLEMDKNVFSVSSSVGCEKALGPRKKCFVRVRADGKKLRGEPAGVVEGTLVVGSLRIPLSLDYNPLMEDDVDVSIGNVPFTETMDYECFEKKCYLALKVTNEGVLAKNPMGFEVPAGYDILYNSCNQMLKPKRSCHVRLKIRDIVEDLTVSSLLINVNGRDITKNIRLVKEEDTEAPAISVNVLNTVSEGSNIFVTDERAQIKLFIDENRLSKGVRVGVSNNNDCSNPQWSTIFSEELEITPELSASNNFSFVAEDALGNSSSCIPLTVLRDTFQGLYSVQSSPVPNSCMGTVILENPLIAGSCRGVISGIVVENSLCSTTKTYEYKSPAGISPNTVPVSYGYKRIRCNEGSTEALPIAKSDVFCTANYTQGTGIHGSVPTAPNYDPPYNCLPTQYRWWHNEHAVILSTTTSVVETPNFRLTMDNSGTVWVSKKDGTFNRAVTNVRTIHNNPTICSAGCNLVYQGDGNLVVYRLSDSLAIKALHTHRQSTMEFSETDPYFRIRSSNWQGIDWAPW